MKELIEKADNMERALTKLMNGLATDGTAIEGFTDAWKAKAEYIDARFKYEFDRACERITLAGVWSDRVKMI